jgi:hypothetical protein
MHQSPNLTQQECTWHRHAPSLSKLALCYIAARELEKALRLALTVRLSGAEAHELHALGSAQARLRSVQQGHRRVVACKSQSVLVLAVRKKRLEGFIIHGV